MTDPLWSVSSCSSTPPVKSVTSLRTTVCSSYPLGQVYHTAEETMVLGSQTQGPGKCLLPACSVSSQLHEEATSWVPQRKKTPSTWQLSLAFSVSQAEIRIEWEPKLLRPPFPRVTKWARRRAKRQMALELMRISQTHDSVEIKICHLSFQYKIEPAEPSNSYPQMGLVYLMRSIIRRQPPRPTMLKTVLNPTIVQVCWLLVHQNFFLRHWSL